MGAENFFDAEKDLAFASADRDESVDHGSERDGLYDAHHAVVLIKEARLLGLGVFLKGGVVGGDASGFAVIVIDGYGSSVFIGAKDGLAKGGCAALERQHLGAETHALRAMSNENAGRRYMNRPAFPNLPNPREIIRCAGHASAEGISDKSVPTGRAHRCRSPTIQDRC